MSGAVGRGGGAGCRVTRRLARVRVGGRFTDGNSVGRCDLDRKLARRAQPIYSAATAVTGRRPTSPTSACVSVSHAIWWFHPVGRFVGRNARVFGSGKP